MSKFDIYFFVNICYFKIVKINVNWLNKVSDSIPSITSVWISIHRDGNKTFFYVHTYRQMIS